MSYVCGRLGSEEIPGGCLKEVHHSRVFPRGGVRYVDDDRCALERFGQPFAGERVYARVGRCCYRFVSVLTKFIDEL